MMNGTRPRWGLGEPSGSNGVILSDFSGKTKDQLRSALQFSDSTRWIKKREMIDLSKSQMDRLGERLKKGSPSDEDLILLDHYRQSFSEAYETVFRLVSEALRKEFIGAEPAERPEPTGRAAKSTGAIIEKLRRESIRLTQIQDIAGCRVVVRNILQQERFVRSLVGPRREMPATPPVADPNSLSDPEYWAETRAQHKKKAERLLPPLFAKATVVDRRTKPSHGYRAVHIIAKIGEKPIEIQIRSRLQHLWAELSEKFSDVSDPDIKYGGGDQSIQSLLGLMSQFVTFVEKHEGELITVQRQMEEMGWLEWQRRFPEFPPEVMDSKLEHAWGMAEDTRQEIDDILMEMGKIVLELERMTGPGKTRVAVDRSLCILLDRLVKWERELSERERRKR